MARRRQIGALRARRAWPVLAVVAALLLLAGCTGRGGDAEKTITVPELTGLSPGEAIGLLCDRGLFPGAVTKRSATRPPIGTDDMTAQLRASRVLGSSPAAGAAVPVGSAVAFWFDAPSSWHSGVSVASACDFGTAPG